jgi:hypothetical protein
VEHILCAPYGDPVNGYAKDFPSEDIPTITPHCPQQIAATATVPPIQMSRMIPNRPTSTSHPDVSGDTCRGLQHHRRGEGYDQYSG